MKINILLPLVIVSTMFLQFMVELVAEFNYESINQQHLQRDKLNTRLSGQIKSAQLHFKTQVQEWKNILLRAHDPALYKKHLKAFSYQEDEVKRNLQALLSNEDLSSGARHYISEFLRLHTKVGEQYRLIIESHDLVNKFKSADSLIRGVDRQLDDIMENAIIEMQTDMEKVYRILQLSADRAENTSLFADIFGILAVAIILYWLLNYLVVQPLLLANSVAQSIANNIDVPPIKTSRTDEAGQLLSSLNKMQFNLSKTHNRLSERIKELKGLYQVSRILDDIEKSIDEILYEIVSILPASWQYPEICCARITHDGKHYETENFRDSSWKISSQLLINGEIRGVVEVCYLEERPLADEGPFFKEERELLESISKDIRTYIEKKESIQNQQSLELQLHHAQKMEAVGQLAAGIAHEINTPIQFVNDNTHFLQDAFAGYDRLITSYNRLTTDATAGGTLSQARLDEVKTLAEEIEVDYLKEEIPRAVKQSLEGLIRITRIVQAMKEFSHPGSKEKTPIDLNRAIQTTIDVSRNEWKYSAELITELDPELPQVPVLRGEFNQVMLNLIVNATHAITDVMKNSEKRGEIRISTRQDGEWVEIRVSDSGKGIPEKNKKQIFDPFFTTKEVGKGSGQGLAIAWSTIVGKHGGTIEVESEEGKGSTFIIRLPVKQLSPDGK